MSQYGKPISKEKRDMLSHLFGLPPQYFGEVSEEIILKIQHAIEPLCYDYKKAKAEKLKTIKALTRAMSKVEVGTTIPDEISNMKNFVNQMSKLIE